jgi:hypothetical protein
MRTIRFKGTAETINCTRCKLVFLRRSSAADRRLLERGVDFYFDSLLSGFNE